MRATTVARPKRRAPKAIPTRIVEDRPADPGAVVAAGLIALAPVSVAAPAFTGLDLVAAYWVSTGLLLAGELVLATTARRGVSSAPRRIGRLSPVALRWVAAFAALVPVLVIVTAFADPVAATRYVGAFFAAQCMMVFGIAAFSEIARKQDWNARGGRSADPRVERGEPLRIDVGAFLGIALVAVAPFAVTASLAAPIDPVHCGWVGTGLLVAGAVVLGLTAGRADGLAPARRGRLSSAALRWVVALAVVTPVTQLAMLLTELDALWAAMAGCLAIQSIAVIALITLPSIARGQERGGPLYA
ncbi:hypothetical protein JOE59_002218 [Agromyces cerinus]|uniref:hypothetical protein n=1 Tax=Agromyces cerinus TaxID=33878 RepID=UPI00195B9DDF|nr:hypothetical protein [Agromyces cerinus]MBM7831513.1 hypothetical protein [Agromyces cerinus]